jgi:putative addiction module antidote
MVQKASTNVAQERHLLHSHGGQWERETMWLLAVLSPLSACVYLLSELTQLPIVIILSYYIRNNRVRLADMFKVKVTPIGNSMGIVLPKEALTRLKAAKGDVLYLVDGPEGLTLTPYRQDFDQQMEAAEKVLKKYRNALHELAK